MPPPAADKRSCSRHASRSHASHTLSLHPKGKDSPGHALTRRELSTKLSLRNAASVAAANMRAATPSAHLCCPPTKRAALAEPTAAPDTSSQLLIMRKTSLGEG